MNITNSELTTKEIQLMFRHSNEKLDRVSCQLEELIHIISKIEAKRERQQGEINMNRKTLEQHSSWWAWTVAILGTMFVSLLMIIIQVVWK